jgi:hypothetical protein
MLALIGLDIRTLPVDDKRLVKMMGFTYEGSREIFVGVSHCSTKRFLVRNPWIFEMMHRWW